MSRVHCPHCRGPIFEIDYYGERLIGCIACNRWGKPDDKELVMELMEADLEALKTRAEPPPISRLSSVGCSPEDGQVFAFLA